MARIFWLQSLLSFAMLALVSASAIPETTTVYRSLDGNYSVRLTSRGIGGGTEEAIKEVVSNVVQVLIKLCLAVPEGQGQFTQKTVADLQVKFPNKNIMMVHPKHTRNFSGEDHLHVEFNNHCFGTTTGYEIYVFDYGDFKLNGERGFNNWCFSGKYTWDPNSNGNFVSFSRISIIKPIIIVPHPTIITKRFSKCQKTDGAYLVNCSKNGVISSGVAYYKKIKPWGGNIGQQPDDYVDVQHGKNQKWEISLGAALFPKTKTYFLWSLKGGAYSYNTQDNVGTANNGYHPFYVYKDSKALLYTRSGWNCNTIYMVC